MARSIGYREFLQKDLAALNAAFTAAGVRVLPAPAAIPATACGAAR